MKVLVVLAFVAVAFASNAGRFNLRRSGRHFSQNVTEMIAETGYPVQNFTVQTADGYILDVIRIPGTPQERSQFESQMQSSSRNVQTNKPVVLLQHSLLSTAEDFVIGGPSEGLAYFLADQGYDVFMGNSRGNEYGRRHTQLNPEKDAAFWRFCWQDIGKKDLPAMIDEILEMTQQPKLYYIGHQQGATAFYVLTSERPEYNDKIQMSISMGPVAFLGNTKNTLLRYIANNQQSMAWQMQNLGLNELKPSQEVLTNGGEQDCMRSGMNQQVCDNIYFLLNGFDSENMNMTTVEKLAKRVPAGASVRQIVHYAQLVKTGRFEKYISNVQQHQGEEYDLSKITTPVALIYSTEDMLSQDEDVQKLAQKLPNVIENVKLSQIKNNMDLLFSKNVDTVVYRTVLDILRRY